MMEGTEEIRWLPDRRKNRRENEEIYFGTYRRRYKIPQVISTGGAVLYAVAAALRLDVFQSYGITVGEPWLTALTVAALVTAAFPMLAYHGRTAPAWERTVGRIISWIWPYKPSIKTSHMVLGRRVIIIGACDPAKKGVYLDALEETEFSKDGFRARLAPCHYLAGDYRNHGEFYSSRREVEWFK